MSLELIKDLQHQQMLDSEQAVIKNLEAKLGAKTKEIECGCKGWRSPLDNCDHVSKDKKSCNAPDAKPCVFKIEQ